MTICVRTFLKLVHLPFDDTFSEYKKFVNDLATDLKKGNEGKEES